MTLAIDDIYQDSIIIADWHYNTSPATPEYFAGLAFNVMSVQWKSSSGDSWQPGLDHLARYINADPGISGNMLGVISANWRGLNKCRLAYYKLSGYEEEVKEYIENARIVMSQWRDDDTPVYRAGVQSIHPVTIEDTDSVYTENDDGQVLELGVRFEFTLAGTITKVKIYVGNNEGGDHTVRIWDTGANEVLSGPHTWTITAGTEGWKEYTLPTPLSVQADVDYTLSVSTSSDYLYSKATHYWYSPRTTNNIITFRDGGVYTTSVGSLPTSYNNETTYYRDIVYQANE